MSEEPAQWWRDAVVYEIYPRSYSDSNGDGVGDLPGVTARLEHVAGLGAQAVWLTPFQRSPQADHGYDVSDYCDVDPLFGDLAAFDVLLERAHDLGLKVVIDLVPNHCSAQHPLFRAALAAGAGSPERARFHFAAGRGDGPPNNWPSVFGGSAWTRVDDGEWYLHLHAPEQPDWNWRDPRTEPFFEAALRFWLDRGVDGLRIDVAHGVFKAEGLPDLEHPEAVQPMRLRSNPLASDRDETHAVYRRWRQIVDGYEPPRALVGEVNLEPHRAARYTRPGELHQAFALALLMAPWSAGAWADAGNALLEADRAERGGGVTWVTDNHDLVRTATRYGGGLRGPARARAAVLAVLGLPGAAYLYQGQELGLPQAEVAPAARQDPAWARVGISRDGCRVPLPWRPEPAGAYGFTTGRPWLPVPAGWGSLSAQAQEADPGSTLRLCRAAVALRRRLHDDGTVGAGDPARFGRDDSGRLLVERGARFRLVLAMGDSPVPLPDGDVLLTSASLVGDRELPPDAAAWLLA